MKLSYLASCALIGTMLVSCTNNLNEPTNGPTQTGTLKIIKDPQVIAWSGNQTFSTRSTGYASDITANSYAPKTRTEEDVVIYREVETKVLNRKAENELIEEILPEKNDNLKDYMIPDFVFYSGNEGITFEIYPIHIETGTANHLTIFYFKEDNPKDIKETIVWNDFIYSTISKGENIPNPDSWVEDEWNENGGYYTEYNWVENVISIGREITIKAGYYFGFVWNGDYWPVDSYSSLKTRLYSSSGLNPISYRTNGSGALLGDGSTSRVHAITFVQNEKTYLGFEDWTDFDYQDQVFTCDKELTTVPSSKFFPETETSNPTTPPADDDCPNDKCDHPLTDHNPDGTCRECQNNEGCNECPNIHEDVEGSGCDHPKSSHEYDEETHTWTCTECEQGESECNPSEENGGSGGETGGGGTTDTPTTPTTPSGSKIKHNNEVEINLELQDSHSKYDVEDLVSKLSIHVRYGGDIEVFLPVPYGYYCDVDDLDIREADLFVKDGIEPHTVFYDFDGHTVSLTVDYEDDGIRITTSGITQEVLDYCYETYGDGINFEVYNYYALYEIVGDTYVRVEGEAGNVERDVILGHLNRATVEFLGSTTDRTLKPNYYINAFGWDYVDDSNGKQIQNPNDPNPDDCTVSIIGDQRGGYSEPTRTEHLNGTPFNDIYTKNGVPADDAHVAHNHN